MTSGKRRNSAFAIILHEDQTVPSVAERHLQAGYRFYESQSEGLGSYFLDSLIADVESLHTHAGIHAVCFGNYHCLLAKRFPYSVYYRIEGDEILIYAILDNRSNPKWISRQIGLALELEYLNRPCHRVDTTCPAPDSGGAP